MGVRTGAAVNVDGSGADSGNENVLVPSDCTAVVVLYCHFTGGADLGAPVFQLDSTAFDVDVHLIEENDQYSVGAQTLPNPTVGASVNFDWNWAGSAGARTESGQIFVVFVKEVDTGDLVRDAQADHNDFGNAANITLTSITSDLVIGMGVGFGVDPVTDGTQFFDNIALNSANIDGVEVTAGDPSTLIDLGVYTYPAVTGVSLKDEVGTEPQLSLPTEASITETTATVGCTTDTAAGTLYAYVSTSATPPSVADLKDGTGSVDFDNQTSPGVGIETFAITGLSAGTNYYSYFLHNEASEDSSILESGVWSTLSPPGAQDAALRTEAQKGTGDPQDGALRTEAEKAEAVVRRAFIAVYESMSEAEATVTASYESQAGLIQSVESNYESLAEVLQTVIGVHESLAVVVQTSLDPYEARGSIVTTVLGNHEALQDIAQTGLLNYESLELVATIVVGNHESLAEAIQTVLANHESRGQITVVFTGPWESLTGLTKTIIGNHESQASPLQTIVGNHEALAGVQQTVIANWESLGLAAISQTFIGNYESLASVIQTAVNHHATTGFILRAFTGVYEAQGVVEKLSVENYEFLTEVLQTEIGNYESQAAAIKTILANWEALGFTVVDQAVQANYEALKGLIKTEVGNHESLAEALQAVLANHEAQELVPPGRGFFGSVVFQDLFTGDSE